MTEKLENLANAAASLDAEFEAQNQQNNQSEGDALHGGEVPLDSEAKEWAMVAYTIGQALGVFAPRLKQIYSEQACEAWGHAVVPVARKYDIQGVSRFPEISLILATAAFAVPTYLEIKAITTSIENEARKAAAQKPPESPASA
jgi:hypothetical protein